ncbi:hypothetical protein PLESTB_000075500 [Pleodorina starrii]|uniref:EF-hand domain-containing protein n=1 Tax=Pleodorina starrii TaxID=330485 RepID=A0A9W6B9Y6_9CHLO|nr:hypothetical protein PLESTM_000071100 [Pleodorina starrii]GLC48251.1 hypothetical protein PLESTB_000075500 [Pleodorina starrii]GLC66540.1 hypothetical protein PLESTF_000441700 [Pleodorina starrii]
MGCAGSKSSIFVRESPLSQALEKKLVDTIISTKRRKSFVVKKSSFNNLMLQMPKLVAGFKKIREAHAAISGSSGKVTWGTFKTVCTDGVLGLTPDSENLKDVFNIPYVGEEVLVTHPDLILIYTIIFLLDGNVRRQSIASHEVRACLDLMEKSFMFFDSSADGCIERKELAMAMKSGTRVFGRKASKTLADHLFDQLDWSKDGQITFKEFLIGMERIVMETAGDDDDDRMTPDDEDLRDLDADWEEEEVKQMGDGQAPPPSQLESEKVCEDGTSPFGPQGKPSLGTDEVRPFTLSGTGTA